MSLTAPPSTTGPIRGRFLAILDFLLRWSIQVYSVGVTPNSVTVLLDERGGHRAALAAGRAYQALADGADDPPRATLRQHTDLDGNRAAIVSVHGLLPGLGEVSFSTQLDADTAETIAGAADHDPDLIGDEEITVDLPALRVAAGLGALTDTARQPEPADADQ